MYLRHWATWASESEVSPESKGSVTSEGSNVRSKSPTFVDSRKPVSRPGVDPLGPEREGVSVLLPRIDCSSSTAENVTTFAGGGLP
jgi:hypothetical protein